MTHDPVTALPLIAALSRAVSVRALYPGEHPRVGDALAAFQRAAAAGLRERGSEAITLLVIDQEVVVDERPLRSESMHLRPFARSLSRAGVQRLTLARGLGLDECRRLVSGLAGAGELASTAHVVLGQVQIDASGPGGAEGGASGGLSDDLLDSAGDAVLGFRTDRRGSVERLDRLIWRFIEGMAGASRSLLLLAPVEDFDHYFYVHSVNVALLTLAQARGLGIRGPALHEIGVAAMLHDVGKLSLPKALLARQGALAEREWAAMQLHPELGAARLAGLAAAPPLAVLVAYEHHLRWDGKPSFPRLSTPRFPNLASQLTAVADTYDVMIAGRGLERGSGREAALEVWRARAGTFLDPFLVANFVLMLADAEA